MKDLGVCHLVFIPGLRFSEFERIIMLNISFRDHAFLAEDCHLYDLSVHCSPDGLSILILRPGSESLLFCEHYPFGNAGYQMLLRKIREWISGQPLLNQTFRKTTLLFGDRQVSIVPETLFSEKLPEFLFPAGKKQEMETESIVVSLQQMGANLVFRTRLELFETLSQVFPGAEVTHETVPLLQHLVSHRVSRLHFHIHSSWFYALSVEEGKVDFINSFDYKDETDMLFYMMSVHKEFNTENHPVFISGFIDTEDSRFVFIKKHIPGVTLAYEKEGALSSEGGCLSRYFFGFLHGKLCV